MINRAEKVTLEHVHVGWLNTMKLTLLGNLLLALLVSLVYHTLPLIFHPQWRL